MFSVHVSVDAAGFKKFAHTANMDFLEVTKKALVFYNYLSEQVGQGASIEYSTHSHRSVPFQLLDHKKLDGHGKSIFEVLLRRIFAETVEVRLPGGAMGWLQRISAETGQTLEEIVQSSIDTLEDYLIIDSKGGVFSLVKDGVKAPLVLDF
jgi:hypothetical protein